MNKSRVSCLVSRIFVVVGASVLVASPAMAEGMWESTVSDVYKGFGSRTWIDKNRDRNSNYAKIYSCNRGATLAIYRNRQAPIPDQVVGSEKATCDTAVPYNDGTSGDIHFTIKSTQNNGGLYGKVKVGY